MTWSLCGIGFGDDCCRRVNLRGSTCVRLCTAFSKEMMGVNDEWVASTESGPNDESVHDVYL